MEWTKGGIKKSVKLFTNVGWRAKLYYKLEEDDGGRQKEKD
ncbi:uncharacterized protein G2W53_020418 [Senna tora]|uniref:Uncharacterized protein n=1 Tax=Senna tora TaxID=362788 RepID=A0A834TWI6_9FABA|nr:uncharacterized protein G2W53_020418 [Senna tora]